MEELLEKNYNPRDEAEDYSEAREDPTMIAFNSKFNPIIDAQTCSINPDAVSFTNVHIDFAGQSVSQSVSQSISPTVVLCFFYTI